MSSNPLIQAIASGDEPGAFVLIEAGKFINDYDDGPEIDHGGTIAPLRTGRTPLIVAADFGRYECVRRLLENGAKVHLKEKTKVPPFKRTALSYAALRGHVKIAEALLDVGADPNCKDDNLRDEIRGSAPLHYAAAGGHIAVVDLLLARGAFLNECTRCGNTPLIAAMDAGQLDMVRHLMERGADLSPGTASGWTVLLSAISNPDACRELIAQMLARGASPDGVHGTQGTPLMQAVMRHRNDVVLDLIKMGANVNMPKSNGFTPLMYAVLGRDWQACEILISNHADVHARNNAGKSAFAIAESEGTANEFAQVMKKVSNS